MGDLLSIYRALELIEARLRDDLRVAEMAAAAGYSLYHFIRAFNQLVYHTPYDYLMRRRLSEAAGELVCSDRRVLEIALDYRFDAHETFSRAFKRLFGMPPTQWRERGVAPRRTLTPPLSLAALEHSHQPGFQRPQVAALGARTLAGLMAPISDQPGAADGLWRSLEQVLARQARRLAPVSFYEARVYLETQPEVCFCLAAVEITQDALPPLVCLALPPGRYLCQAHCGPAEALPLTLDFLYHTWLPKTGLSQAYPLEVFAYGAQPPGKPGAAQAVVSLPLADNTASLGSVNGTFSSPSLASA